MPNSYPWRPLYPPVHVERQGDTLLVWCPYDRLAIPALKARGAVVDQIRRTWHVPAAAEPVVHQVLADQFGWDPETQDVPVELVEATAVTDVSTMSNRLMVVGRILGHLTYRPGPMRRPCDRWSCLCLKLCPIMPTCLKRGPPGRAVLRGRAKTIAARSAIMLDVGWFPPRMAPNPTDPPIL